MGYADATGTPTPRQPVYGNQINSLSGAKIKSIMRIRGVEGGNRQFFARIRGKSWENTRRKSVEKELAEP